MRNIYLDTNILLDFLGDRKPFSKFALQFFQMADNKKVRLYASSDSITTTYYILTTYSTESKARSLVSGLLEYIQVIPVSREILERAFASDFRDAEDAVQAFCALSHGAIEFIVSRDLRDFKHSPVNVLSPEQAIFELLNK